MRAIFLSLFGLLLFISSSAQEVIHTGKFHRQDENGVFTFVQEVPQFPGGDSAISNFLQQHLVYPKQEREAGHSGRTVVKFIINEDGSISNPQTVQSSGYPALDKEAVRVIQMAPKFKPGKQDGKTVKVFFNMPVYFKL